VWYFPRLRDLEIFLQTLVTCVGDLGMGGGETIVDGPIALYVIILFSWISNSPEGGSEKTVVVVACWGRGTTESFR